MLGWLWGSSSSSKAVTPEAPLPSVKLEHDDSNPFLVSGNPSISNAPKGRAKQEAWGALPPLNPPTKKQVAAQFSPANGEDFRRAISVAHRTHLAEIASNAKVPLSPPATPVKSRSTPLDSKRKPTRKSDNDDALSSASGRPVRHENFVQEGPAPGLITPSPSTRKATRAGRRATDEHEEEEESNQTVLTPLGSKTESSYVPPTPDPSPVKTRPSSSATSSKAKGKGRASASTPPTPLSSPKKDPRPDIVFLGWVPADHGIVGIDHVEDTLPDGTTFVTLKVKNGDHLKFYQALDVRDIVNETLTRDDMARDDDPVLKDLPQGRILGYEMGLGKTHVACAVIVEHADALKLKCERMGWEYDLKPVLVICDKTIQWQWKGSILSLSGDAWDVAIYDRGRQPLPRAHAIIANIAIVRLMYERYLSYWERMEQLYRDKGRNDRPDRENPTPSDLVQLRTEAPFFVTQFRYLIIDEFHSCIANPSTMNARAVLTLSVTHHLLLSGTPAQNKLDDLQVAVALMQHPSKRLDFKDSEALYRRLTKTSKLDSAISRLMKPKDVVHFHSITPAQMFQIMITRRIDLRQSDRGPLIELSQRTDFVVALNLNGQEAELEQLMAHIPECHLVNILRRRQACLHPALLTDALMKLYGVTDPNDDLLEELDEIGEDVTEKFPSLRETDACVLETSIAISPRLVQEKTNEFNLVLEGLGVEECFQDDYLSSKIKVTLGILKKTQSERKGEKTIIFSIFTSLLERLSGILDGRKIKHALFTGKKDRTQREKALQVIASDPHCSVMLVSMKAGGTGLNITACSNVIILDPWWNPYVEEQAISRVYRMGQTRAVQVYRIIAPNTIEKKITNIQENKRINIDTFTEVCAMATMGNDIYRQMDPRYPV
ncbi:P-loop containing nucleoside triphosphate hydrolase protein [Coprinopsis sp. MPI-PUGE-AT-0042]|nr:P-loop containing nucleoside triphosphate hydrolase protein [Coprinopsis sp. MPI-PUGE-AT-0042]